jgi:hypothetical protein
METNTLFDELQRLLLELKVQTHEEVFARGRLLLLRFKERGGEKEVADDILNELMSAPGMTEERWDLLGDLLDCVHGWVGNPDWRIW